MEKQYDFPSSQSNTGIWYYRIVMLERCKQNIKVSLMLVKHTVY